MKLTPVALFFCSFFTSTSLVAGIMREDISIQDYRDFAENLGKYQVGKENVEVFKTDGTSAGILAFPIPDFGSIVSGGFATLFSPSYLISVKHNGGYQSVDFGNNAKYKTTYKLINRNDDSARDFHIPRLNKVVTEAPYLDSVVGTELSTSPDRYTWYARAGGGTQVQIDAETKELVDVASSYSWKSGGTIANPTFERWRLYWDNYAPDDKNVQVFDSVLQLGDSGSPMFVYDNYEKVWKIVGVGTGYNKGSTPPYGMWSYILFIQDELVSQVMAANTDPDVTDIAADGTIRWSKAAITQGENSWSWHGVDTALPSEASNAQLDATKDLRFNGEGGLIVLNSILNQGAGRLQFSNDYTVKPATGSGNTWVGGGIEVDAGKTVLWQVNGLAGDDLHKIGAGTLHVNATGINGGGLNTGDGTVILDQQADAAGNKQAFSSVTLVSGRPTVVLNDAEQVATDNIYFGYRGGTLDLNGNSLTFKQINHTDSGATLLNHNTATASTLTLTGQGAELNQQVFRGFLGDSENGGQLNVNINVPDESAITALTGGMDLKGNLDVSAGTVLLSGQPVPHAGGLVIDDDWATASFSARQINVSQKSALQVGEYARVSANIVAEDSARVVLGYSAGTSAADRSWRCYSVIDTDTTTCSQPVRSATELAALTASNVSGDISLAENASLYLGKVNYTGAVSGVTTSSMSMDSDAFWQLTGNSSVGQLTTLSGTQISMLATEGQTWSPTNLNIDSLDATGLSVRLAASPATEQSDKVTIASSATGSNNILDISVLADASAPVSLLNDMVLLDAPGGTAHDYFTVPSVASGFSLYTPDYKVVDNDGRVQWVLARNAVAAIPTIPATPIEPDVPSAPPVEPEAELPATPEVEPVPEVPTIPAVEPEPEVPATPEVKPEPEVPATPEVKPEPEVPAIPEVEPVPELPVTPEVEPVPEVPTIPAVKPVPEVPAIPAVEPVPEVPTIPAVEPAPEMPSVPAVEPDVPITPAVVPETEAPVIPAVTPDPAWFTITDNQPLIRDTRALLASRQYIFSEAISQLHDRAALLRHSPDRSGDWVSLEHNKGSFAGLSVTQQALNMGWDTVQGAHMYGFNVGYTQGKTTGNGDDTHRMASLGASYSWFSPTGWFVDAASRYMYLSQDLSFDPVLGIHHGKVESHILAVGVKTGFQLPSASDSLFISPYIGISGGYLPGYGLKGQSTGVNLSASTPYFATAGFEVKKRGLWRSAPDVMVTTGLEYQYSPGKAGSDIRLSDSQSGRDFTAWSDNRYRAHVGIEGALSDKISAYLKLRNSFGGTFRTEHSGNAGISYSF